MSILSNISSGIQLAGSDDADSIVNNGDNVTITSGAGNDTIINQPPSTAGMGETISGSNVIIDAGDGNNVIDNSSSNVTINGGAGDDSVENSGASVSINVGDGNDTIRNYGSAVSLNAGAGNDSIYNSASAVTIEAGDGNDSIFNNGSYATISPGAGNDTVSLISGSSRLLQYSSGNDVIVGFNVGDTIQLLNNSLTASSLDDNDIVLYVGNGTVRLHEVFGAVNARVTLPSVEERGSFIVNNVNIIDGLQEYYEASLKSAVTSDEIVVGAIQEDSSGVKYVPKSGVGRQVIYAPSSWYVAGTDYNDSIVSEGEFITINPGKGNDTLYGSSFGEVYLVGANTGNNLITTLGVNDTLQLVNGTISAIETVNNDLVITIESANNTGVVTLGGAGQYNMAHDGDYFVVRNYDEYSNTVDNILITTSDRADSITNSGADVTIRSAGADDTIENSGARAVIETGADDDIVINDGVDSTIRAGLGDDSINNASLGTGAIIFGGTGIDTIINAGANVSISTGDGNDYVTNTADNVTVDVSLGSDYVSNSGAGVVLSAGEGSLRVDNYGSDTTITAGDGVLGYGYYSASNYASNVTIQGGDNDDSVSNSAASVSIDGGAGDDHITNSGSSVTIEGGAGDDHITNSGSSVTIDGGAGAEHVNNYGSYSTIDGGDGNDSISNGSYYSRASNVSINAGADDDNISNNYSSNVTIDAGDGDDYIINSYSDNASIDAGDGDDQIYVDTDSDDVTVAGGAGNDTINHAAVYQHSSGNDVITAYSAGETVQLLNGTVDSASIEGTDVILYVGEGTVRLVDKKTTLITVLDAEGSLTTKYYGVVYINNTVDNTLVTTEVNDYLIDNSGANVTIRADTGNDTINNTGINAVIGTGDGINRVVNEGAGSTITGGGDSDTVENTAESVAIDGGAGVDYVTNRSSNVTIVGGDETSVNDDNETVAAAGDNITNYGSSVLIDAGDGNDEIYSNGDNVTLDGGAGADYVTNYGSTVEVNAGDGADHIYSNGDNVTLDGGAGADYVTNYGSTVEINAGAGADHIYNYESSNVSVNAGAGADYIYNDGSSVSINAGVGDDTIDNSYSSSVTIDAGAGADYIRNYEGATVSINAGSGNDLIYVDGGSSITVGGGAGNDTVNRADVYQHSAGNDVITAYTVGDTIQLLDHTLDGVSLDGMDVIFTVDGGSLTVIDGRLKKITLLDGNDSLVSRYFGAENVTNANDNTLIAVDDDGNHVVENVGENVTITSGAGNDYIINSGAGAVISVGAGDDIIDNSGANATIDLGAGADSIVNSSSASYAVIDGGDGEDTIENHGAHSTIGGGAGDDYITNESDASYSVVDGGDGDDQIYNHAANSTVNGGAGDDYVYNSASNAVLDGGDDNDRLYNYGDGSTVLGGAGDDYVRNEGASVDVDMGEGDNTVSNGTDTNTNTGAYSILKAGAGDDSVENFAANTTIDAGDGNNYIENSWYKSYEDYYSYNYADNGAYSSIRSGAGVDTIVNHGSHTTIDAGTGNDSIISGVGYYSSYDYGSASSINGGAGNDSITNYGSQTTVDGGAGADYIVNGRDSDYDDNHADNAVLNGGAGADTVINYSSSASINGGAGSDSINNYASNATLDGGAGNDVISIGADAESNVVIYSGGNDTVYGFYSDTDSLQNAAGITFGNSVRSGYDMILDAGADGTLTVVNALTSIEAANASFDLDDAGTLTGLIVVNGHYVDDEDGTYDASFKTDAGWQDVIVGSVTADHVYEAADDASLQVIAVPDAWTVRGTSNDDIINATGSLTAIDGGDGNDRINNSGDYASINGGEGDNFINNYGTGSLAGGSGDGVTITAGAGNDTVRNRYVVASGSSLGYAGGDSVIVNTGDGNNYVENSGNDVTINAGVGADTIDNNGDNIIINAGDGADSIVSGCENVTINGADGADTVFNQGSLTAINAGDGNDFIVNDGIDVTIDGGTGNDKFVMREGSARIVYADGDGNDTVYGYDSDTTTIEIASGLSTTSVMSGDDILISVTGASVGSIRLRESYDGLMTVAAVNANVNLSDAGDSIGYFVVDGLLVDDTAAFYDASFLDSIASTYIVVGTVGSAHNYVASDAQQKITVPGNWLVNATANDDTILIAGNGATVDGGAGNDVISISGNAAVIEYSSGGGDDTVYGFSFGSSTLEIASGLSTTSIRSGDDIILGVTGSGSITLVDAGPIDSLSANVNLSDANGSTGYFVVGTATLGDTGATYDAYLTAATGLNEFLIGSVDTAYIYSAASNTRQNITVDSDWTVTASGNNDYVEVIGSSANVDGAAGNDTLVNSSSYVTLNGGGGSDAISLGSGSSAAIVNYSVGDGADSVYGYAADDATLRIAMSSPTLTSVESGGNLVLNIYGMPGSITLINFNGAVNAIDADGNALEIIAPPEDTSYVNPNAIVNLADASASVGYFVVNAPVDSDTFYSASFASVVTSSDYVIVGSVTGGRVYTAVEDANRQNIIVADDGWSLTASDFADSIDVASGVASISFFDITSDDLISFDDAISLNSLFTLDADGASTLFSDQVNLTFNSPLSDLTSLNVGNGDTVNSFAELIYNAPDSVSAFIELDANSAAGFYVVNGRSVVDRDTFYSASFVDTVSGYDVAVGDVAFDHQYSARGIGRQSILVEDNDWSITSSDFADEVKISEGVSAVSFFDVNADDLIIFADAVSLNSLFTLEAGGSSTLYSNQINLTFNRALNDLLAFNVDNATTVNSFAELIYNAPTSFNSMIELSASSIGSFAVNGRTVEGSDTFYAASFVETVSGYDVAVGDVSIDHQYFARNIGSQQIFVDDDNWSIRTGADADSIYVGSGVASLSFIDLNADDLISFSRAVDENSLISLEADGVSTLYSDQINLTFNSPLSELISFYVDNAGDTNTFVDLIYNAPAAFNSNVNLSSGSDVGAYVVNGRLVADADAFYDADFTSTSITAYDVAVGDVTSAYNYSARNLGRQSITVSDDGWSIRTAAGADSIFVADGVSAIAFTDLDLDDVITFADEISPNSLFTLESGGSSTLYSDQISLGFSDRSVADLMQTPFADLIYSAPSTVNALIDLSSSTIGSYVVNGRTASDSDTFYNATLTDDVSGYDVAVGDVSGDHNYSARSIGHQSITVSADDWSIRTAAGVDSIYIADDVSSIAFTDLDADDVITFSRAIDENSLLTLEADGNSTLYSDQINIGFSDRSIDDLMQTPFADLIYSVPSTVNALIDLSASSIGSYVVNGRTAIDSDTFYDAAFVETVSGYNVAVGDVSLDHQYSARNVGHQSITVSADDWSIRTAAGVDSIYIADGVSSIAFTDLDADDLISFADEISLNSLFTLEAGGNSTLYSDQINLAFSDRSIDDLMQSSFADLIYSAPSTVNALIDLSDGSTIGSYVVDGRAVENSDTFYNATLTDEAGGYDVAVGDVSIDHQYSARNVGHQSITVSADDWSIRTAAGVDSIYIAEGVSSIAFTDLDADDLISFADEISLNSLFTLEADGNSTLYSDQISIGFSDRSVADLMQTSFADLIYSAPSTVNALIDLSDGSTIGSFVVDGRSVDAGDTFYSATLTDDVSGYDVAVGDVSLDHQYSARNVGHQSITVSADDWSIRTAAGVDSIYIAEGVSSIAFTDLDADDLISFDDAISLNSLFTLEADGSSTLYSDQINIGFSDRSIDDLMNSAFADLIYSAPSTVNALIDLSASSIGSYVVDGRTAIDSNTVYSATLTDDVSGYDVAVGDVSIDHQYSARGIGHQSITVNDNGWSIRTAAGVDSIYIADGVSSIAFTDLDADDLISFDDAISLNSLFTLESDGNSTLYSDQISIGFNDRSIADLMQSSFADLIYSAPSTVNALIELSASSIGSFVVDGRTAIDSNTVYSATLTDDVSGYDVAVGDVSIDHQYSARNVGHQSITVNDNGWSIKTAAGVDSIYIADGVSSLAFTDLDTDDVISFSRAINANSLLTLEAGGNSTLYSDQISIGFNDRSVADLMQTFFGDLIYSAPSSVNSRVNLSSDGSSGSYVVNGSRATNPAALYDATLTASSLTPYDVAVGDVDNHQYSARNIGHQSITVNDDNWSIKTGAGADSIYIASAVSSLTFVDLDNDDLIYFSRAVDNNSLLTLEAGGNSTLYSDQISLTFNDRSIADLMQSAFADLIYSAPDSVNAMINLSDDASSGYFVVDGSRVTDPAAFYDATLTASSLTPYDVTVGNVNNHQYSARNVGNQMITVGADGWSIASGAGNDTVFVTDAVSTIAFNDLSLSDRLSFDQNIPLRSLSTLSSGGNSTLQSDLITLAFDRSISAIQRYVVDDDGIETSIYQLLDNPIGVNLTSTDNTGVFAIERTSMHQNASLTSDYNSTDIIAGSVSSAHVYIAAPDSPRQSITAARDWAVTATNADDTINIHGNGATIEAGDGADVISVGDSVTTITFNDFADEDRLSFSQSIEAGSLHSTVDADGAVVLYSDQILLTFENRSLDELKDATVRNGATTMRIEELLAPEGEPNAIVDLSTADGNGVYVIHSSALNNSETLYAATFTQSIDENDIVVGTVEGNTYTARSNFNRQAIGVNGAWNVTAAELDDFLYVTGSGATLTAGDGADSIVVADGVSMIAFTDLSADDPIAFAQRIEPGSLLATVNADGGLVLYSEQITLAFNQSADEILNITVDNGGTPNTIEELIYVEPHTPKTTIDLTASGSNGVYVVDGRAVEDSDTFYAATFASETSATDIIVGTVEGGHTYVARLDANQQEITVNDLWHVTATELDDLIRVTGDGSTVHTGAGNDTVAIADGVSSVVFADLKSNDLLSFDNSIAEHSLISLNGAGNEAATLYSDQITLVFDKLIVANVLNYSVDNGGEPMTLEDLIYSPSSIPSAAIDLNVDDAGGVFVVDGRLVSDLDEYYQATYTHSTLETDHIVGAVDEDHVYSARSDARSQQITARDYWRVTATKYDDLIAVEGADVTINTGKGNDTIVIGDGATTITFGDLSTSKDALSFSNAVEEKSMSVIEEDGALILTSDALTLTFEDKTWSEMRRYVVDNAGVDTRLEDLIKPSTQHMELALWSYDYESGMARSAALDNGSTMLASARH